MPPPFYRIKKRFRDREARIPGKKYGFLNMRPESVAKNTSRRTGAFPNACDRHQKHHPVNACARLWPQALPSRARARCSLWAARDHAEHRRATALAGVGARLPDELRSLAPLGAIPLYKFHIFLDTAGASWPRVVEPRCRRSVGAGAHGSLQPRAHGLPATPRPHACWRRRGRAPAPRDAESQRGAAK